MQNEIERVLGQLADRIISFQEAVIELRRLGWSAFGAGIIVGLTDSLLLMAAS